MSEKIQYVCPKCGNKHYESDQFQATGGNFAKIFDIQNNAGWNVLDFLLG